MNKVKSKTKLYHIWTGMKRRCGNPNDEAYKYYGGRGIKCLWKSFEEFKNDMNVSFEVHLKKYGEKYTQLERIDNDKNYCKKNCRWVTPKENCRNRSSRVEFSYKGQTKSITEWAEHFDIPKVGFWLRIFRYKWPIHEAIVKPFRNHGVKTTNYN